MKINTVRYWRFSSVGFPDSTQVGEGDLRAFLTALTGWYQKVTMGSRVDIQVYRSASDRDQKSNSMTEAESMLAEIMGDLVEPD